MSLVALGIPYLGSTFKTLSLSGEWSDGPGLCWFYFSMRPLLADGIENLLGFTTDAVSDGKWSIDI